MELERIIMVQVVDLSDLFLLFIYAEVLGMVGIFYRDKRIPVTLPIIIAITALTRMIVIQSKGFDGINIIYEASGILLLAVSAYIMTMKDKISLSKIKLRKEAASEENQEQ
jgi:protein PsiE